MAGIGPRPYGVGTFGAGAYSDWPDARVYDVGGASGITFDASLQGLVINWVPAALTGIVFSATAELELTWPAWAPCEDGAWQPAGPCEEGGWQPSTGCKAGAWDETRLEELV